MIYVRGPPTDYDRWAEFGGEGWGYEPMLPHFRRSEHFEPAGSAYHGMGGPLNVAEPRSPHRPAVPRRRGRRRPRAQPRLQRRATGGSGALPPHPEGGKRHSAADPFLAPALDRPNLRAETGAHAPRVAFDGDRATGVEFRRDGREYRVRVDREVVVRAGAVESPPSDVPS